MADTHTPALTEQEINRRFLLHKPDEATGETMNHIRVAYLNLAHDIADLLPAGREAALAYTHLEIALHYSIAQLARDGSTYPAQVHTATGQLLAPADTKAEGGCCRDK